METTEKIIYLLSDLLFINLFILENIAWEQSEKKKNTVFLHETDGNAGLDIACEAKISGQD